MNTWTRRRVLHAAGAVATLEALAGVTSRDAQAQFTFANQVTGSLQRLAPDVYAYVQSVPPGESGFAVANCGLIAGGASLLAVDATAAPAQAQQFIAAARGATGKRFGRVVLTHYHGDHVHGLALFGPVQVIAQEQCRTLMAATASSTRPAGWQKRRGWATGNEPFRYVLPTTTFSERMTIHDAGAEPVQLLWLGRAHTGGDTLVHLPRSRIAFIGDVGFFGMTPLMGDGFCSDWIEVCDRVLALDADVLVPGHGPVGDKAALRTMREYLLFVRREARLRFDRGLSPGRAAADIDLAAFRAWPDADRIVDNVVRLYAEFAGTLAPSRDVATTAAAHREYAALTAGTR